MSIHVNIVSAEGAIFEGDADMVFAPTAYAATFLAFSTASSIEPTM